MSWGCDSGKGGAREDFSGECSSCPSHANSTWDLMILASSDVKAATAGLSWNDRSDDVFEEYMASASTSNKCHTGHTMACRH